nr:hypothetical protein [Actinomycetota bacterium]NIU19101.1 hypothetical protein [Actinomycetota bacterium]NIV55587.1 hypothetical protein [Actinomycetota bacterium]NIX20456.1 hypothetical protein [Actinomycetota bacterium]NIX50399.1 hypothetical protein [Actinomycetota bacterium]
ARAVEPGVPLALYQSAADAPWSSAVSQWSDVGGVLAEATDRWHPAAVGINLVDLNDGGVDPVGLVERAAAVLLGSA